MPGHDEPTKKCPLCGETIPASAEVCPSCGAHLDIFELEEELGGEDTTPLESFLESIGDAEDVDPEKLLEEMQSLLGNPAEETDSENPEEETSEGEVEAASGEDKASEEDAEEEVLYVCPVCDKPVAEEDLICPHCGAIFVEDEEDMKRLLEEQLDEAKTLIKTMRSRGIDVSKITPYLKNANISKRKGDIETALENAITCVLEARKMLGQAPSNSS